MTDRSLLPKSLINHLADAVDTARAQGLWGGVAPLAVEDQPRRFVAPTYDDAVDEGHVGALARVMGGDWLHAQASARRILADPVIGAAIAQALEDVRLRLVTRTPEVPQ